MFSNYTLRRAILPPIHPSPIGLVVLQMTLAEVEGSIRCLRNVTTRSPSSLNVLKPVSLGPPETRHSQIEKLTRLSSAWLEGYVLLHGHK